MDRLPIQELLNINSYKDSDYNTNWHTKLFFMAEIDNEEDGGDSPATLDSAYDSLESGYEPFDGFDKQTVLDSILILIQIHGCFAKLNLFVNDIDWKYRKFRNEED